MELFDRFSDAAKRAVALAQDEMERWHHSHIGPENLLMPCSAARRASPECCWLSLV